MKRMPGQFAFTKSRYSTVRLTGQQSSISTILVTLAASSTAMPSLSAFAATTWFHRRRVLCCFVSRLAQWLRVCWYMNLVYLARTLNDGRERSVLPLVMKSMNAVSPAPLAHTPEVNCRLSSFMEFSTCCEPFSTHSHPRWGRKKKPAKISASSTKRC